MRVTVESPEQTISGFVDKSADLNGTFVLIDDEDGTRWTVDGWLLGPGDLTVHATGAIPVSRVYDRSTEDTDTERKLRALDLDRVSVGARMLRKDGES